MKFAQSLKNAVDLPDEPSPGEPLIEISGQESVLIEHHRGVVNYTNDCIGVRVKYGTIQINGRNLALTKMTKEQLIISGEIDSVELLKGGC